MAPLKHENVSTAMVRYANLGLSDMCVEASCSLAWYVAQDNSVKAVTAPTGNITVNNNANQLGDIYVLIEWGNISNDVNYTDNSGNAYYYAGTVDNAHKIDVTTSATKTGTAAYTLSLKKRAGSGTQESPYTYTQNPSVDELTAAAGTYTVTFTASGEVKIGNSVEACIAVNAASSTATASLTIASSGITSGGTGNVIFGFMGTDSAQTGTGGTIEFTSVA